MAAFDVTPQGRATPDVDLVRGWPRHPLLVAPAARAWRRVSCRRRLAVNLAGPAKQRALKWIGAESRDRDRPGPPAASVIDRWGFPPRLAPARPVRCFSVVGQTFRWPCPPGCWRWSFGLCLGLPAAAQNFPCSAAALSMRPIFLGRGPTCSGGRAEGAGGKIQRSAGDLHGAMAVYFVSLLCLANAPAVSVKALAGGICSMRKTRWVAAALFLLMGVWSLAVRDRIPLIPPTYDPWPQTQQYPSAPLRCLTRSADAVIYRVRVHG